MASHSRQLSLVQHHILESCVTCTASHSRKLLLEQHHILDGCFTCTSPHSRELCYLYSITFWTAVLLVSITF